MKKYGAYLFCLGNLFCGIGIEIAFAASRVAISASCELLEKEGRVNDIHPTLPDMDLEAEINRFLGGLHDFIHESFRRQRAVKQPRQVVA